MGHSRNATGTLFYLTINEQSKNIFIIKNPYKQYQLGNLKVNNELVVAFNQKAGKWQKLQEIKNYR